MCGWSIVRRRAGSVKLAQYMGSVESGWRTVQTATRARARLERVAAVWENAGMSDLPRVHAPSLPVWRRVLLELLRRERDGERPPSIQALGAFSKRSRPQTREHIEAMQQVGLVELTTLYGHHGSDVKLTGLGRLIARLLEAPLEEV